METSIDFTDLERIALSEQGMNKFESLFPGVQSFSKDISWTKIKVNDFSPGYGLLLTDRGMRVSKLKYNLPKLLRYVGLNMEDFKDNLYRIRSGYDEVVYGYHPTNKDLNFLVVGKRIKNSEFYYQEGDINSTKTIFQNIQEWFSLQESLRENSEKQQGQNNVAV